MPKLAIVKVRLDREVNGYVVSCAGTKEAVVIDPGLPVDKIAEQLKGLKVRYIVATHCHPGHVAGKDDLKDLVGGETALHSADAKQFLRSADRYLIDGDELEFGEFKLTVLHTPGHTPGSQCFLLDGRLVAGDTLFLEGCGRTDFPGGDVDAIYRSLQALAQLPGDPTVFPGHWYSAEPSASLSEVRRTNYVYRASNLEQWRALMGG